MGYMDESVAARCFLDARVHPIYEGITGIQALDLTLRKVARGGGEAARELLAEMKEDWPATLAASGLSELAPVLEESLQALESATASIVADARTRPDRVQAVAVHYF